MKTAVFTNMYLRGNDVSGRPRIHRALKWLEHMTKLQTRLGFDQIYISDNGGQADEIWTLLKNYPDVKLIRHPHLDRGKGHNYLPCWRTTHDYQIAILDGYKKLILIDDDAFILSDKLMNHIYDLKSGWESLYCPRWNIPECGLHVLCADAFNEYYNFVSVSIKERNDSREMIETTLPFTKVNKEFNADRFGELRIPQQPSMDAYFQCPVDIEMKVSE